MSTPASSPLRAMFRNFGLLLSGRGAAAVLGLLATMVMARGLAAVEFGMVVLIHTSILLLRGLLNAKPFEAVVRYGVHAQEQPNAFANLLRFTLTLDWGAAILATLLALLLVPLFGPWLELDSQATNFAMLYAAVLLLSGTGTAKGLLRLHGRFAVLGAIQAIAPAVRLLVFVICYLNELGPLGYLLGFGVGLACEYLMLLISGNRLARKLGLPLRPGRVEIKQLGVAHPGLWRLLNAVYWQSNLDLIPKHAATLLAGGLLGSAAAGYFRLARDIASVLSEPATLLRQAVFPDLARLKSQPVTGRNGFGLVVARLCGYALIPGLLVVGLAAWQGDALITALTSSEYLPATGLMVALLAAATVNTAGGVLRVASYAADRAVSVLVIATLAQLVYLLTVGMLAQPIGLIGFGYAAIAAAFIELAGTAWLLRRALMTAA